MMQTIVAQLEEQLMKPSAIVMTLLIGCLSLSMPSRADDIDIYAGLAATANTPNIMVVIDNPSSQNNSTQVCTYWDNTIPSNNGKALGSDQCALVNLVQSMPTKTVTTSSGATQQAAQFNFGLTTMSGVDFPLTPLDDNPYTGPATVTISGNAVTIPAGTSNRYAIIMALRALGQTSGLSGQGAELQETWAYYTGGIGTYGGINTATGLLSQRTYPTAAFPATNATSGCQKNYIIYLSNVSAGASHAQTYSQAPSPQGELPSLNAAANLAAASGVYGAPNSTSNATFLQLDPAASGYTGMIPYPTQESPYALEWARFMFMTDISGLAGMQGVTSYSIATGDTAPPGTAITSNMELYISQVAHYGGGKYYAAGNDPSQLENDILKILNEVQAVNSVFSSSTLPVSVNAQGTYLNQIFMGMFRPDAQANPRWMGNLKQYQFIYNSTTQTLSLGDSLGDPAISASGTGFISPNAVSFWTCTLLTTPYADTWLNTLSSSQITMLTQNQQSCVDPLTKGFWASDSSSTLAAAKGYDMPDGELVERGGAGQQIRHVNLTATYTGTALATGGTELSPRKVYTYCPSGSGCVASLTDVSNAFSENNGGMNASQFGVTTYANISTLSRNPASATADNVVTVTTTGANPFATGDWITIANATPPDYNGLYPVTVLDSQHFTYNLANVYPVVSVTPTNNTNYSATNPAAGISVPISGISYANNTVTVTTASPHGFLNNAPVAIQGVTPAAYDGSFPVTVLSPTSFSYPLTEQPPQVAGSPTGSFSATATIITKTTGKAGGITCPCSTTFNINPWNFAPPGASRPVGSTTVTFTTVPLFNGTQFAGAFIPGYPVTISGVVDPSGAPVAAYNGSFTVTSVGGNTFTISTAISPAAPSISSSSIAVGVAPVAIASLTRAGNVATATTAVANSFATNNQITIGLNAGATAGPNEQAYAGSFPITVIDSTHFTYPIATTPATPATAIPGSTMTATRFGGLQPADYNSLINWVRAQDNVGDEQSLCPGGALNALPGKDYTNCPTPAVTVRPSVHGDVLHSRPVVINYGSYTIQITGTSDSGTTRTATVSAADGATVASGGATPIVTFANGQACPVTVSSSQTALTYLASGCGNPGAQTAFAGAKVVVFYGDNGGVFHAVNGNQAGTNFGAGPGDELWGFIPREFFSKLPRLRNNSPQMNLPSTPPGISPQPLPKDYFIDGEPGVYQVVDANGNTTKAVLYLSMRRGGQFIYALDVTNPNAPQVLWRVDNFSTGMAQLGQTWSQPKVALLDGYCGGTTCSASNPSTPVLIFGGGYDTNEDNQPMVGADGTGRAIFILDALNGNLVWKARYAATSSCSGSTTQAICGVAGMQYAIPADITLMDSDFNGTVDRAYAADTGGNIWRVDLAPPKTNMSNTKCDPKASPAGCTPDIWQVNKLAALGCANGACPIPVSPTQRKFFFPPEVIQHSVLNPGYDAVVAGSGDREHPLFVSSRRDHLYLLKDTYTGLDASGMGAAGSGYPLTTTANTGNGQQGLYDATTSGWNGTLGGYYITLGSGEKVVNAPLYAGSYVYVGTNTPPTSSTNTCLNNLGTAMGYQLSPFAGTFAKVVFDGGGLPPSPVSGVVGVVVDGVVKQVPFIIGGGNPNCGGGADCTSSFGTQRLPIPAATTRSRTYRYIKGK